MFQPPTPLESFGNEDEVCQRQELDDLEELRDEIRRRVDHAGAECRRAAELQKRIEQLVERRDRD